MPERCRRVSMTQEKTQLNQPAGAGPASTNSGASSPGAESGVPLPSASSSPSSSTSIQSSTEIPSDSPSESAINKELRRLNRALRALSASNQALAQAGSEQELLQQICDVIVHMGAYLCAWIGYAQPDEYKTVRPIASRRVRDWIPQQGGRAVVGYSGGPRAGGHSHPGESDLRGCGYGERSAVCALA